MKIYTFAFKKLHLKMSSGKWRPFCLGLNVFKFRERLPKDFVLMLCSFTLHWPFYSLWCRYTSQNCYHCVNTLRPRHNGRHFPDDTFKPIFLNENIRISIKISLKFVPKVPINNIPALVQIMAWRRSGDKPLSEPKMVSLLTHICVTRPQWVSCLPG